MLDISHPNLLFGTAALGPTPLTFAQTSSACRSIQMLVPGSASTPSDLAVRSVADAVGQE
jgi:hypothetical protein